MPQPCSPPCLTARRGERADSPPSPPPARRLYPARRGPKGTVEAWEGAMDGDVAMMREAIRLSLASVAEGGGPFGCVIVRGGEVVGAGANRVTRDNDPTAHAEVVAIRDACRRLGTFRLDGVDVYASCEPCPMCLAALYWARVGRVFYAATAADAAAIGFDDAFIDAELGRRPAALRAIPLRQMLREEAVAAFAAWTAKPDRTPY